MATFPITHRPLATLVGSARKIRTFTKMANGHLSGHLSSALRWPSPPKMAIKMAIKMANGHLNKNIIISNTYY